MRAITIFVLAVLTVATVGACTSDVDEPASSPAAPTDDACGPVGAALDDWAAAGFSGAVVLLTGDDVDCAEGYGPADRTDDRANTADTVFSIGSVTKAVTAAAVVDLVERGEVAGDDPAGRWVPELTGPVADVTVDQLLVHTSGVQGRLGHGDHQPLDRPGAIADLGEAGPVFEPGSDFAYSNAGYTLLALIVEAATGTPFRDHLSGRLLVLGDGTPIGGFWDGEPAAPAPRAVGYLGDVPGADGSFAGPHWALDGNGGVAMTPIELARWTRALFGGEILADGVASRIRQPGHDHGDGTAETPGWVAFDDGLVGEAGFGASGGGGSIGHEITVAWFPESDRTIVVASNGGPVEVTTVIESVIGPWLRGETPTGPATGGATSDGAVVDTALLEAAAGTYQLTDGSTIAVTATAEELRVEPRGPAAIAAVFPPPPTVGDDEVAAHEARVVELLAGRTAEGRRELEQIEGEIGPVSGFEIEGTGYDGELRTHVTIMATTEITGWYALDGRGGVAAVELGTSPARVVRPSGDGAFAPAGGGAGGPILRFDEHRLTIEGHGSIVEATAAEGP